MDRFRADVGDRSVFIYLGDILVLSETLEKHVEDINSVFQRLQEFHLSARRDKCSFSVEVL